VLTVALTLAGCGASGPTGPAARVVRCTNAVHRDSVAYPAGWYTTQLGAEDACSYFDPMPFHLVANSQPPVVALQVLSTGLPLEAVVAQIRGDKSAQVLSEKRTSVKRHRAAQIETLTNGAGFWPSGTLMYAWVVDDNGTAIEVSTTGLPGYGGYPDHRRLVDAATRSLQFQ
jgi:hypothetical protein